MSNCCLALKILENLTKERIMEEPDITAVFIELGNKMSSEGLDQIWYLVKFRVTFVMPNRKISRNLKLAAIKLYEGEFLTLHDILDCVSFSK
jgi:hypothetical protein